MSHAHGNVTWPLSEFPWQGHVTFCMPPCVMRMHPEDVEVSLCNANTERQTGNINCRGNFLDSFKLGLAPPGYSSPCLPLPPPAVFKTSRRETDAKCTERARCCDGAGCACGKLVPVPLQ